MVIDGLKKFFQEERKCLVSFVSYPILDVKWAMIRFLLLGAY